MRSKLIVLISSIFFLILCLPEFSKGPIVLKEVFNPLELCVSDHRIYVAEKYSVHIYKKKEFNYITTFGSKGEGPGEIRLVTGLASGTEKVTVSSGGSIHIFSPNGEYIKSHRSSDICWHYAPIGNKFIGTKSFMIDKTKYKSIIFLDSNFNKEKEIYRYKRAMQNFGKFNILNADIRFYVSGNRIFINGSDDRIHVFNENGEKIKTITPDVEREKVTSEFKTNFINAYKSDKKLSIAYEMYKSAIEFSEYFPSIQYYRVSGDRVYIITYKQKQENYLCVVMDVSGKTLKKVFVPLHFKKVQKPYPFDVHNGILYQAVEGEDDEPAELHMTKIK